MVIGKSPRKIFAKGAGNKNPPKTPPSERGVGGLLADESSISTGHVRIFIRASIKSKKEKLPGFGF